MTEDSPRRCGAFAHLLGKSVLRLTGWKLRGEAPQAKNCVIIAAPHTTNWDFIYLLAAAYSYHLSINWLGKSGLFWWPLGPLLRFLGGIPIDRSKPNNMVQTMVDAVNAGDGINLVVPPAGTRGYTDHWKSGFYRIAEAADIPMVCGYLDYSKKEAGLGMMLRVTNVNQDMDRLRQFYGPINGKYPEKKSRIRLREED